MLSVARRLALSVLPLAGFATTSLAGVTANQVIDFAPGSPVQHAWWDDNLTFDNPNSAKGLPNPSVGNDPFSGLDTGALTPFNPPYHPNDIVRVSAGGSITLKLSAPVSNRAGSEIGVFANNGIADVTPGTTYNTNFPYNCTSGGTGTAGAFDPDHPEQFLFSAPPKALVYVKQNLNDSWTQLGTGPITFANPTNSFTDVAIDKLFAPLGNAPADYFKPFEGSINDFASKTYPQMVAMLGGSAGGTWLDIGPSGLSSVQYVQFVVPTGADYRMMIDAVTAVPEPASLMLFACSFALIPRRSRR